MKKISKPVTKEKLTKIKNNLFTENVISLDDSKNQKYFDDLSYQQYLSNLNNESSDLYD